MEDQFDVSVVIPTYNRSDLLFAALESLVAQELKDLRYEVIVVDNNSTDRTAEVVKSFGGSKLPVRYVFEARQGHSYARNAGISQSRAPIVAFADDDVTVSRNWLATIKETFDAHPEIGFIGGKVQPVWVAPPPRWLTSQHWGPLALQDHGDSEFYLEPNKVIGVISANLGVRRELFEKFGMFSADVQMVGSDIGGMEDHEYVERLWRAGVTGLYVPKLVVHAPVDTNRTRKTYHRRWHKGHGRHYAIMREGRMEKASWCLFGVPAHLYRQGLIDSFGLVKHWLRRQEEQAFLCEAHLWFFLGFWSKRVQDDLFK